MSGNLPKDWSEAGLAGNPGLLVAHADGEDHWRGRSQDLWSGSFEGLQEFRRSRAAVVYRWTDPKNGKSYFIKRLQSRGLPDLFKHMFRASRGRRALLEGARLEGQGFQAPKAVCLIERRCCGSVSESLLVTEEIADVKNIYDWFNESRGTIQEKRALIAAYGAEVGRMHGQGIFHGDMRKSNVLFRSEGDTFTFYWLDNERNEQLAELSLRKRVKNLTQVNMEREGVTITDRMRFWKAYAEAAGIGGADARQIQKAAVARTRKRWLRMDERRPR